MPDATRTVSFAQLVVQADPDYNVEKRKQVEYEFSNGRKFVANPAERGAYAEDEE